MTKLTVRFDSSQLVQLEKCMVFHHFISVENLTQKFVRRTVMDRGTVMHGMLQRYYQKIWEKDPWPAAMNYAIEQLSGLKKGMQLEDEDYKLIIMRFTDYCVKYNRDSLTIVGKDKPALEIGFSIPLVDNDSFYFVLEGRIDMLVEMSGKVVVWDHKAQGRDYKLYGHSIQMLDYALAVGTNMTMYNYIRLHQKIQYNTFQRELTTIPMWLQERWKQKLISMFYKAANFQLAHVGNVSSMLPSEFPKHACSDIGFGKICPFSTICVEQSDRVRRALLEQNFMAREPWSPWSLDEIAQESPDAQM